MIIKGIFFKATTEWGFCYLSVMENQGRSSNSLNFGLKLTIALDTAT